MAEELVRIRVDLLIKSSMSASELSAAFYQFLSAKLTEQKDFQAIILDIRRGQSTGVERLFKREFFKKAKGK